MNKNYGVISNEVSTSAAEESWWSLAYDKLCSTIMQLDHRQLSVSIHANVCDESLINEERALL